MLTCVFVMNFKEVPECVDSRKIKIGKALMLQMMQ
jgi:hypothetical protein